MPNYVDLGARLLALRKMAFPSADKALSYCRSLGMPGLRAKKVTRGRLFDEVGDEIRTDHFRRYALWRNDPRQNRLLRA